MRYHQPMASFRTFAEFWPYYLREHSRPATRGLHYLGSSLVVACFVAVVLSGHAVFFLAMPLVGYFFAWVGHFLIERNRPATFKHPLWSLAADWRMWWLWIGGRIAPELEKSGVRSASRP